MAASRLPNGFLDLSDIPDHLLALTTSNAAESPLLRLPPELREQIFRYASSGNRVLMKHDPDDVKASKPFHAEVFQDGTRRRLTLSHTGMNLALVSRQLYCETVTLPYVHNTFALVLDMRGLDITDFHLFLSLFFKVSMPQQRTAIQALFIRGDATTLVESILALKAQHANVTLPGLRKVIIVPRHRDLSLSTLLEDSSWKKCWEEQVDVEGRKIEMLMLQGGERRA
ncbi:hypothetical protein P171DRAFT_497193 [Karstenula rhodostoma CBS 690.94]|uniref:DUF7730 domain-containing protein n=1 Tax=Karstenula rhodostoma CBS 690.94 TaxID=1392251 RepID=A0A9P4PE86_9PLEO|nr:hypothetical protein P171DRAFT_497193 [Karstenula rhodostoma CBS 690.94]